MDNNLKEKVIVVFRNDDPSACSDVEHERRIADMFDRYKLRQTLGIVPQRCEGDLKDPIIRRQVRLDENPRMIEFLREYVARSGSEIALHGYTHKTNRLSCPSRREHFEFEGLSLDEQEEMIARGTEILANNFGARPYTFIPPWNRMDRNTILACLRQGYKIISSGPFAPVTDGIQSLGVNCDLDVFPSLFENSLRPGRQILLIVMYHSRFLTSEIELASLETALDLCALSPDTEVLTLAETVRLYPDLVRQSNEAAMNIVPQQQVPGTERSRAVVYQRALLGLGMGSRLKQAHSSARAMYWQGKYKEAYKLSPLIDLRYRHLQMFGRSASVMSGAVIGVSIWAVSSQLYFPNQLYWFVGALAIMALTGSVLRWCLTNKDAKREILVATLLVIAGAVLGIGVGQLISSLN